MKISEMMLLIVLEAGGEIEFTQWKRCEGKLIELGYLENMYRNSAKGFTCFVRLTDKGRAALHKNS